MKRVLITLLTAAFIAFFVFLWGCSDDDDVTGPTPKAVGDTLDPIFTSAAPVFEFAGEMTEYGFEAALQTLALFLEPSKQEFVWHSESGFWYLEQSGAEGDLVWHHIDSIQFLEGNAVKQYPDSAELTGIKCGLYFLETYEVTDSILSSAVGLDTTFLHGIYFDIAGAAGELTGMGDVTVSGNSYLYSNSDYYTGDHNCDYMADLAATINNVSLNIADIMAEGCPISGSISYSGRITMDCQGDTSFTSTDNWIVTETYNGESVSYVVENSTYRWAWTYPCGHK